MARAPQLAAFDIDGTLLDPTGRIRPKVHRAIDALRASGTTVILATGRSPWDVAPIAADLGLTGPHVMVNGGTFSTPGDGQVVWARRLAPDLVRDTIAFARQFGTRPVVNFVHRQVIEGTPDGSIPADVSDFIRGPRLHMVDSLDEVAGHGPIRIYVPTGSARHAAALTAARERFGARASVIFSDEWGIEIMTPGTNKGEGVRLVAESMGFGRDDVAAFGDGANDLEMLAWAGRSAAMAPAPVPVRAVARVIVPSSADDGVVKAISRFFPSLDLGGGSDTSRRWLRQIDDDSTTEQDEPAA